MMIVVALPDPSSLPNQGRDFMKFALPVFSAFVVSAILAVVPAQTCAEDRTVRSPAAVWPAGPLELVMAFPGPADPQWQGLSSASRSPTSTRFGGMLENHPPPLRWAASALPGPNSLTRDGRCCWRLIRIPGWLATSLLWDRRGSRTDFRLRSLGGRGHVVGREGRRRYRTRLEGMVAGPRRGRHPPAHARFGPARTSPRHDRAAGTAHSEYFAVASSGRNHCPDRSQRCHLGCNSGR